MLIRRIQLRNICGLRDLKLELHGDGANSGTSLLIDENGTGKTSIHHAIVMGLGSVVEPAGLLIEGYSNQFATMGHESGEIRQTLLNRVGRELEQNISKTRPLTGIYPINVSFVAVFVPPSPQSLAH